MAFLRVKRIRGRDYAYLVESRWDADRRTSRQVTLQYIGPADEVRLEHIPPEYRDNRARAFIAQHSSKAEDRRRHAVTDFRGRLLAALISGDRTRTTLVAEEARAALGLDAFYVEVLAPTMRTIGDLWKRNELTVSMEHLASNLVRDLVDGLNAQIHVAGRPRGTAVLCTPQGEMHSLAAKVLEGLLLQRGFRSWDLAASAPTDSIVAFVAAKQPDLVLVSLTIPQYLPALRRLLEALGARQVRAKVLVGGQGIGKLTQADLPPGAVLVPDGSLEALNQAAGSARPARGRG